MQLTFETMDELREMIAAMGYVPNTQLGELTVRLDGNAFARDIQASIDSLAAGNAAIDAADAAKTAGEVEHDNDGTPVGVEVPAAGEPTKRKRRTKAEIKADKAAQTVLAVVKESNDAALADAHKPNPLDNLKSEVEDVATDKPSHAEITEMAGLFDGNDKLAHLNEGRAFIEKYTFAVYNETLMLADVPANIAAHTPEQVSRHRAAMAWLAAQKAG